MTADLIQAWAEAEKARYGGGEFWDGIIDMCADWRAMKQALEIYEGHLPSTALATKRLNELKVKP